MMASISPKIASSCSSGQLNSDVLCQALSTLRGIVESCYGPFGRLKLIHNAVGGYVLTTSQSSALLRNLSVSHPVMKLLIASVLNHVSRFSDSGLFTAILCCNLAENAKQLNVPSSHIVKIHKHLLNICLDYLTSEECSCRIQIDFSNSKTLLSLVRTMINKPTCMLTTKEADYISSLVLKAFFYTIPSVIGDHVSLGKMQIVPIEGQSVSDSCVLSGILIEIFSSPSTTVDITKLTFGYIKIAVFNVSMSGDVVDSGNGTWEVTPDFSPEDESLAQLLKVGKQLVYDQVHLVLCQRVIHPVLKQYLQEQQVMVGDRLGVALMEPLIQMTGAQSISSYYHPILPNCYGIIKNLHIVKFGFKQFLHLIPNENKPVCSLLLCNRSEAGVNELKLVCQSAEHVMRLTLKEPLAVLGGGCTEFHLATYVGHKSQTVTDDKLAELGCSRSEYGIVADSFCRSLQRTASSLEHDGGENFVDTKYSHRWSVLPKMPLHTDWSEVFSRCACGLYTAEPNLNWIVLGNRAEIVSLELPLERPSGYFPDQLVLDSYSVKLNALHVAVETANLIVDLRYVIQDQN
ncbi:McKusick-Kaufman/Bardet-Biedl syndromes putative chaperonin isoform X2 [Chiloscyllium plagiosum]|uniref:McKusick-Kaufman/Bardet-Biedl syndromes putative chaperonin isoform X2 n=1 Tax=Chiloscyllium plagiosum TaxID=36176 RepID=UPI001CB8700F|nr:McKusick-Kaufman/Bardet-Biedl syndromes putative chaperonin isoform X2 [Chiloscyllium plagiosum]